MTERASAWAVTASLLNRIWNADMQLRHRPEPEPAIEPPEPEVILVAATLMLPPSSERAGAIAKALLETARAA